MTCATKFAFLPPPPKKLSVRRLATSNSRPPANRLMLSALPRSGRSIPTRTRQPLVTSPPRPNWLGQQRFCRRCQPRPGSTGRVRYRRQRRRPGGVSLGRGPGSGYFYLPDHRHRSRRRRDGQRPTAARPHPPGDGPHLSYRPVQTTLTRKASAPSTAIAWRG